MWVKGVEEEEEIDAEVALDRLELDHLNNNVGEEEEEEEEEVGEEEVWGEDEDEKRGRGRRHLRFLSSLKKQNAAHYLSAPEMHRRGVRGQGIRVAIFDTAFRMDHPAIKHAIRERTNWTNDLSATAADDGVGHGTFVAGVIASTDPKCPGMVRESTWWWGNACRVWVWVWVWV